MQIAKKLSISLACLWLASCQLTPQATDKESITTEPVRPALDNSVDLVKLQPPAPEERYLWHHMRTGFQLPSLDHPSIRHERERYLRHEDILAEINLRSSEYLYVIVDALEQQGLPLELALLPFVESGFDPYAFSHGGAVGLWQFMPSTGARFGLQQDWWFDGRRDIVQSTDAAIAYMTYLNKMFDGDWLLAIAAYNSGEGRVQRAVQSNKRKGKPTDFFSLNLPAETRSYVPRLLAISDIVRHAEAYGMNLPQLPNKPLCTPVHVGSQIELSVIAELSEVSEAIVSELNPGFNRWATPPDGRHSILIPTYNKNKLLDSLANLPDSKRISWRRYKVRQGDNLGLIAKKHNTTVKVVKDSNRLTNNLLQIGQNLLIPLGDDIKTPPTRLVEIKPIQYKVQTGDSLWLLARRFDVKHQDIARWNSLSTQTLRPGQTLAIYPKKTQPRVKTLNYKVRNGDSLSLIAKRFAVSVDSLKEWNQLNSEFINIGQELTIKVEQSRG